MEETRPNEIDLTLLEKQLYQCLHKDAIAVHPLHVTCKIDEETLIITLQVATHPSLETPATLSCIRDFLDYHVLSSLYPAKIYLTLHSHSAEFSTDDPESNTRFLGSVPFKSTTNALKQRPTASSSLFATKTYRPSPRFPFSQVSEKKNIQRLFGIGLGLGVLMIGFMVLNDPCGIGSCPNLAKAESIAQNSLINLQVNSPTSVLTTKQQLDEAIQLLESVPWWSRFYADASRLATDYQSLTKALTILSQVANQAEQVNQLIQKAPLPVSEWKTAQSLIQGNLDLLKQFPPQSPFANWAIAQQREYEKWLSSINQRLLQEQTANNSYDQAMETVRLAKAQQMTAQSLGDYGAIANTWKKALQQLQTVSEGTTPYAKATKSLEVYRQEFKNIALLQTQEEAAQISYQQAIQEGKLAEKAAATKQWSSTVRHWNNALTNLKQIPQNTLQAVKAKPLVTKYTLFLKEAQENFALANRLQTIKRDLTKICSQQDKACDYSVSNQGIKVRLTSAYLQKIWNLSIQAKLQSNTQNQAGILNHISRLEQSFQIISNQAGLPLQVYNAQGNLMTTYNPLR
ncbi:MAG: hypothetical protein VKJ02_03245 [Snowella sp.]|nr:hypothetical protein [Snowella sp.]